MGDLFSNLGLGFSVVFNLVPWTPAFLGGASIPIPVNILLCLIGALVGTLVGVLPGIGTIGLPPAVVNAVVDALAAFGVTHLDMPLTPAKVWAKIAAP